MAVFDEVISSPLLTDGFALHIFVSSIHQLIVFDPSTGNILIITIYNGCDKCCRKPNTVTLFTKSRVGSVLDTTCIVMSVVTLLS